MNESTKIKELPAALKQDFDIIRKLQEKQKELEERVSQSRSDTLQSCDDKLPSKQPTEQKFKSHPKRITTSNEADGKRFSTFSNSHVELSSFYQERKTKANSIRKKLHEKLSLTNPNYELDTNSQFIGDNCYNSPKSHPTLEQFCTEYSYIENPHSKKGSDLGSKVNLSNKNSLTKPKLVTNKSSKTSSVQSPHRGLVCASVLEMKFRSIVEKCLLAFGDIRNSIDKGVTLPDGDEDATRRTVRVREFSNRFSRNYLYPLDIQLKELKDSEKKEALKRSNQFKQKLLSAYQTIFYGLQAYQNHIPTSMGNCASDKLNILLGNILDVCRIHSDILEDVDIMSGFNVFLETFKLNAELTQEKIKEFFCDTRAKSADSILRSNETKLSLGRYGGPNGKKSKTKTTMKSAMQKRLSMYTTTASFRRDAPWKMAVDSLAKKKFNVKSKYKTATYKHRPPVQKESEIISLPTNNLKVLAKKSSACLKNSPIVTPNNEDNIETMVELVSNKSHSGTAVETGREVEKKDHVQNDLIIKLLQLVLKSKHESENNNVQSNELFELMDKIKEEGNGEVLQNILEELKRNKQKGQDGNQLILNIVQSRAGTAEKGKKRKEPKINSITGDKNAKLICITDENSILESDQESTTKPTVYSLQTETNIDDKVEKEVDNGKVTKIKSGSIVRISRIPKSGKLLKILPKDFALNVIQYKLEFYKHCKNNPMYRKTSNCQPCDLMNSVSDELLDQCLLEVAREIEINDVIDTIYQAELEL